jgi:hydroxymethylbilane synthase
VSGDAVPGSAIRIGTRGSALALAQSRTVGDAITAATGRPCELVRIRTTGDVDRAPLAQIGGTGVFVTAVREALVDGRVDVAVHSFKDLPTAPDPRVALAAVPPRADPADVLCAANGWTLASLPDGARIGTGSPRRAAQLSRLRPGVRPVGIRGNVDTRLRAVGTEVDGVILAHAGLARLGRLEAVTYTFGADEMLPAPAQGALAVECRGDDAELLAAVAAIDDAAARLAATAERSLLAGLEAGCAAPVGASAIVTDGRVLLHARVIATDGSRALDHRAEGRADQAAAVGAAAAEALLAAGAAALMGRVRGS